MDLFQLRDYIIQPSTRAIGLQSPSSDVLLLGTCGIESNYVQYIHQITGPALGPYQMEPATHDSLWNTYLNSHSLDILMASNVNSGPSSKLLIYNFYYATLMARVKYLQQKEPLPAANDAIGMATYYKKYYNTSIGKSDVDNCIRVFKDLVAKLGV